MAKKREKIQHRKASFTNVKGGKLLPKQLPDEEIFFAKGNCFGCGKNVNFHPHNKGLLADIGEATKAVFKLMNYEFWINAVSTGGCATSIEVKCNQCGCFQVICQNCAEICQLGLSRCPGCGRGFD